MSEVETERYKRSESDKTYLDAIRNNDRIILSEMYRHFYPKVLAVVKNKGGNSEDAQDVFQDALIVIYKKLVKDELSLTSSFESYLKGVCRLIWLKKHSRNNRVSNVSNPEIELKKIAIEAKVDFQELDRTKLLYNKLEVLSEDCRTLLLYTFSKLSGAEIAKKMGYTIEYVKRKRYKCKQRLMELIKSDPQYKLYL